MNYTWQLKDWPYYKFDTPGLEDILYQYAKEASGVVGKFSSLLQHEQSNVLADVFLIESIQTSEIEGEILNHADVRSSIRNHLGLNIQPEKIKDERSSAIAQALIASRKNFTSNLTIAEIKNWHSLLFNYDHKMNNSSIGEWRTESDDPMQIVSGPFGAETVHFEAPPATVLEQEMQNFILWFNSNTLQGPIKAAISHLYFETIHPFIDGNGRIGRLIAERALAYDLGAPLLFSISDEIKKDRKTYYNELHKASIDSLDISPWVRYFVNLIYNSCINSKQNIIFMLRKSTFWKEKGGYLNERQEKVMRKMFAAEPHGFEGGITAQKYSKITSCSKATATRDLADLVESACIKKLPARGRSTAYELAYKHE
jgi:Fic family protein